MIGCHAETIDVLPEILGAVPNLEGRVTILCERYHRTKTGGLVESLKLGNSFGGLHVPDHSGVLFLKQDSQNRPERCWRGTCESGAWRSSSRLGLKASQRCLRGQAVDPWRIGLAPNITALC